MLSDIGFAEFLRLLRRIVSGTTPRSDENPYRPRVIVA